MILYRRDGPGGQKTIRLMVLVNGSEKRTRKRNPREREPTNATSRGNHPRQPFDHRKDDPVRFSVLARPQIAQQSQAQIMSVLSGATVLLPT
jgi:hypothetical protein